MLDKKSEFVTPRVRSRMFPSTNILREFHYRGEWSG